MLKRDQIEELLEIEEKAPSKLLAWCTQTSNKVSVLDLKTQQEYPTFEGVQLTKRDFLFTLENQ